MSFTFKRATREGIKLLLSFAGGTGSGKTFSAMEIATGLSMGKPFAVIDTENGRAKHYADQFTFDYVSLDAPFRPERYLSAIESAASQKYPVILIDSISHEHDGDGGLLDWHEEELDRMAGADWQKRNSLTMTAWINPKKSHKHFVNKLLQINAHVILCMRAEEKIEMVKEGGRTVVKPKESAVGANGWVPICEKRLPFEMTASFLLLAEKPGVPIPIKLQEQHRRFVDLSKPINKETGVSFLKWAENPGNETNSVDAIKLARYSKLCNQAEQYGIEFVLPTEIKTGSQLSAEGNKLLELLKEKRA